MQDELYMLYSITLERIRLVMICVGCEYKSYVTRFRHQLTQGLSTRF